MRTKTPSGEKLHENLPFRNPNGANHTSPGQASTERRPGYAAPKYFLPSPRRTGRGPGRGAPSIHQTMKPMVLANNPQPCFNGLMQAGQFTKFSPQHPPQAQGATAGRKSGRSTSPSAPLR